MKNLLNIFNKNKVKKLEFISNIINASTPRFDFYFLISLATALVALGIVANNLVLVIAGMIIAPLLSSILAISLGITCGSWRLIWRSSKIFIYSIIIAFATSFIIGLIFPIIDTSWNILSAMKLSYLSFAVALIAGLTAAYTWRQPNVKDALPGIAIAVTLVPPLSALGLLIAAKEWLVFNEVLQFFAINVMGILLAGLLIFIVPSISSSIKAKKIAEKEVDNEIKETTNNG
jgi:uncharacterized hydrophobic protein (TIGR00271 family)